MSAVDEDDELRAEADRIEQLLDEVRAMIAPPAYDKLEQVLHRVISLYSHGLGRALSHARAAGAGTELDERVSADDLLASLLLLHGLHPLSTEERVLRAIAQVRERLGGDAPELELVGVGEDLAVHVRAAGVFGGGAMSARVAEGMLRRAIEDAAPEVTRIELTGALPPVTEPPLVQIRRREAPR